MKKLILILLLIGLVSCSRDYAPKIIVDTDVLPVSAIYELGVNFTDHMLVLGSDISEYINYYIEYEEYIDYDDFFEFRNLKKMLYTHDVDYLFPQIFYYIPISNNFDTKYKWENYFDKWILAMENRDVSLVSEYIIDTDIEEYIKDIFLKTEEEKYEIVFENSLPIIKNTKKIFVKEFNNYRKNIWPDLSFELYTKSEEINKLLVDKNFIEDWSDVTNLEPLTDHIKFSLSKVSHNNFNYNGLKEEKVSIYMNTSFENTELIELISHHIGYKLISRESFAVQKALYEQFKYLRENKNIYELQNRIIHILTSHYNEVIFKYSTIDMTKWSNEFNDINSKVKVEFSNDLDVISKVKYISEDYFLDLTQNEVLDLNYNMKFEREVLPVRLSEAKLIRLNTGRYIIEKENDFVYLFDKINEPIISENKNMIYYTVMSKADTPIGMIYNIIENTKEIIFEDEYTGVSRTVIFSGNDILYLARNAENISSLFKYIISEDRLEEVDIDLDKNIIFEISIAENQLQISLIDFQGSFVNMYLDLQ